MTASGTEFPRINPAGDQAILVEFGSEVSSRVSQAALAFDSAIRDAPNGVVETAPTLKSVLICFDPLALQPNELELWCRRRLNERDWYGQTLAKGGRLWEIPVVYGGSQGPDLDEVASLMQVSPEQAIELHVSQELTVLCLGFSPGLAYIAELSPEFAVPRRQSYGRPVPAGSILVANRQTVLPATPIPTGWRSIGKTPLPTFSPEHKKPFLFSPGDRVRFTAISAEEAELFDHRALWDEFSNEQT